MRLILQHLNKEPFVTVNTHDTNLLIPLTDYEKKLNNTGSPPGSFNSYVKVFDKCNVLPCLPSPATIPSLPKVIATSDDESIKKGLDKLVITTIDNVLPGGGEAALEFLGGEIEGIARVNAMCSKTEYIGTFSKPNTSPNSLEPSTTGLSPYLKHGCVSPRYFYHEISKSYEVR